MTVGVVADADPRTWVHCRMCQDSAWQECWCPGEPAQPTPAGDVAHYVTSVNQPLVTDCGRHRPHAAHAFVRRCPCVPTNHRIQEQRERDRSRLSRPSGDRE